jgi:hypothetical protein
MATGGNINGTTKNSSGTTLSHYGTWIYWTINSQDIEKNTSNITIMVMVQRTDGYTGTTAYNLEDKPNVSLYVGGSAKTPSTYWLDTRNQQVSVIADWTGNVTHNSDGTLSLPLACSWGVLGISALATGNISGTAVLNTIPRASTIGTVTGNTIGSSCTVNITRASSSFTHQLWYKVGNSGWYDLGKGIGTSKTFTIDIATANQFTTTSSGTMQLCVRTFNGTTQVGSDVYKDVTVYVPDYSPESTVGVQVTGNKLLDGVYVQGKSFLSVYIQATTDYGASIVSCSSTIDGKTYSGDLFDTAPLSRGTHRVTTTIKDSRGKTTTIYSNYITVEEYESPRITSIQAKRDGSDPSAVTVQVKGYVSPISNKNTISVKVTLDGETKTISTSGYTFDNTITFTGVNTEETLTATATVTDIYSSTSFDSTLSTVAVTMDFYNTGKGIAIGKVAEKDGFEVDWESWFNKGSFHNVIGFIDGDRNKLGVMQMFNGELLLSSPGQLIPNIAIHTGNMSSYLESMLTSTIAENKDVEYGTSGVWTYRKWVDGTAECWCTYTLETAVSKSWGSMYYSDSLTPRINYPFTFTNRPIENVTFKGETSAGWLYTEGGGFSLNSTTQSGQYGVCRPTSIGSSKLVFDYYVIGKWK